MKRTGKKRANLRDVAKAAGVSVATASRVLNTPAKVNEETRARVEAVIAELGFVRSAAARAINTGRTKMLGALIPTLDSDIFAQTINAIENRLAELGFSLVVATTDDNRETETRKAQELLDIGVEGLFLSGIAHDEALHALIDRTKVPAIVISYYDEAYHLPTIGYDNERAAAAAVNYLLSLGHKDIAVVHGPAENNDRTRARLAGISTDSSDRSLTYFETDLSIEGGAQAVRQSFANNRRFDAFLCLSDVLAFGVIFEFQRAGLVIPEAVSVLGIQDLPGARVMTPRLSTIRLPAQEMGAKAAKALAHWVETGERPAPESLAFELVPRKSTIRR